jgi:hypothetical protein
VNRAEIIVATTKWAMADYAAAFFFARTLVLEP